MGKEKKIAKAFVAIGLSAFLIALSLHSFDFSDQDVLDVYVSLVRQRTVYGVACVLLHWIALANVGAGCLLYPEVAGPRLAFARVLKNEKTGRFNYIIALIMLPWLAETYLYWAGRHFVLWYPYPSHGRNIYKNYHLGRYALPWELPVDTDIVVDLTCEFPRLVPLRGDSQRDDDEQNQGLTKGNGNGKFQSTRPKQKRASLSHYYCLPCMDTTMPEPAAVLNIALEVRELVARDSSLNVYVHCANGHGRSSLFIVLVMLLDGALKMDVSSAGSARQLFDQVKANFKTKRARVSWQPLQEAVVADAYRLYLSLNRS